MPVTSSKMYGLMAAAAHGNLRGKGPSAEVAKEFIHETPPEKRKQFAKQVARRRKRRKVRLIGV